MSSDCQSSLKGLRSLHLANMVSTPSEHVLYTKRTPFIEYHQLTERDMSAKLAALIDEFEIPIEEVIKWYPAVTSLSTSNCQFEHLFSLFCRLRTIKERDDSYLMAHLGQTVIQSSTNRTSSP